MKKIAMVTIGFLMLLSGNAISNTLQFGLLASGDVVSGNVEIQRQQTFGTIAAGGSATYHDKEYTIGDAHIALRSEPLVPGLRYTLGFKGLYGEVDEEDDLADGTLAALSFLLGIDYELSPTVNPVKIPIEIYGGVCFAPGSLCFEDTERYQEYKGGLRLYLHESAFIGLEMMYRDINFETNGYDWSRDDTIFTAGITLRL